MSPRTSKIGQGLKARLMGATFNGAYLDSNIFPPPSIELTPLEFSSNGPFAFDVEAGTVLATISNSQGATLSILDNALQHIALSEDGSSILKGVGAWEPGEHTWVIRKTLSGEPFDTSWAAIVNQEEPDVIPVIPGTTAFGSWAKTPTPAKEGNFLKYGFNERAIGAWVDPMYEIAQGDTVLWIGVNAWKAPDLTDFLLGRHDGIKHVELSVNNGPWYKVSERTAHHKVPSKTAYMFPIVASESTLSGKAELRAIVTPYVGEPFVLQGFPSVNSTPANGDYARISCIADDMWSLVVNLDPNGSTIARASVYMSPTGNDSNDGSTSSLPVATVDRALTLLSAALGGQVGGGRIHLLAGSYGNFGSARTALQSLWPATDCYLEIGPAPGVAPSTVILNSSTTNGIYCEKVAFRNMYGQGIGRGLTGRAVFKNANSENAVPRNYMSTLVENVVFDGGDAYNAAEVAASGPYPKTEADLHYAGPGFMNIGGGHNAVINCTVTRTRGTGWYSTTLVVGCLVDGHGSSSDIQNNTKSVFGLEVRNVYENTTGTGTVHVDGFQFQHGDGVNVTRTMYLIDGLKGVIAYVVQGILADLTTGLKDIAIVNLEIDQTQGVSTTTSPALAFGKVSRNIYVYRPKLKGALSFWRSDTPSGGPVAGGDALGVSTGIRFVLENIEDVPAIPLRYGLSAIYPDTLVDPGNIQPENSFVQDLISNSKIYGIFDLSLEGRVNVVKSSSEERITGIYTNSDYGTSWVPGPDVNGDGQPDTAGTYTTTAIFIESSARSRGPTISPNLLNGQRTARFNGIQSISAEIKGSALTTNNAGFPAAMKAIASGGLGVGEIWAALDLKDLPVPTTGQSQDKVIWAGGGTTSTNSLDIRRRINIANQNALFFGFPVTNGTPVRKAAITPAGISFQGPIVIRCQMLSDRGRITVWSESHPEGVSAETLFGDGYVSAVNGNRMNLGGDTVNNAGTVGQFPLMDLAFVGLLTPLSGSDEASMVSYARNRFLGLPLNKKLLPGTGFAGVPTATPGPAGNPSDVGYEDMPTLAWSVTQNQDVTGKFTVTAIADHTPTDAERAAGKLHNVLGINFVCEGGEPVFVAEATLDVTTGRLGYSVDIDPLDFIANWPVSGRREFRFWPVLSCGQTIVMQGADLDAPYQSLFLNVDGNNTLFYDRRYVHIIDGLDTNDGKTPAAPKKTVHSAKEAIFANPLSGGQVGGGEVVHLHNGGGYMAGDFAVQNSQRFTNGRWFTIRGSEGVRPIFDQQALHAEGWRIAGVRFIGCDFTGGQRLVNNDSNASHRAMLSLKDCNYVGEGQHVATPVRGGALIGPSWRRVYVEGGSYTDSRTGIRSANLVNGTRFERIGEDVLSGTKSSQNITGDVVDRGPHNGTSGIPALHPDIYAFNSDALKENITGWNWKFTKVKAQGISSDNSAVSDVKSASFRHIDIEFIESVWNMISFARPMLMVHFGDVTFRGPNTGNMSAATFSASAIRFDNCYSTGMTTVRSGQGVFIRGGSFPITFT